MAASDGTGTTIAFGTSLFTANVHSINGPQPERGDIKTSHLGLASGSYHTYIPTKLVEGGTISMTIEYAAGLNPPLTSAAETVTIDFGGAGNAISFSGYMKSCSPKAEMDALITAEVVVKVAGDVTGL
jgi:hypothetical protein